MQETTETTDMSGPLGVAVREMRARLLAMNDKELMDTYYKVRTLAEHEAHRRGFRTGRKQADDYGLALMMVRESCDDPAGVAREALLKYGH